MRNNILFIDTSAWYAFFDKNDKMYETINHIIKNAKEDLFTTNYIIDELITLFHVRKFSVSLYRSLIDDLFEENLCFLQYVTKAIDKFAWEIKNKYADHEFSFTDCTSFAVMKENNIPLACSLDKHFKEFGVQVIPEIN